MLTTKQRLAYNEVFSLFTQETGIKVHINPRSNAHYKLQLPLWLAPDAQGPDVLYWQASQRLFSYVERYHLPAIDDLWQQQNLDQFMPHLKPSVSLKGHVYAIPFAYYHWGLYFKKSLLARYGPAPTTWDEFIHICQQMKRDGLTPIGLGSVEYWPAAGWFDYIDLRLNGLDFHLNLLAGDIPFTDPRVKNVLQHWKQLLDLALFNNDSQFTTWEDISAQIYREKVGFTLIGNFALSKWPSQKRSAIGFTPFPQISDQPRYELAPSDVFILNPNTSQPELARAFLGFIARPDIQSLLAHKLGFLPVHSQAIVTDEPLVQVGYQLLQNSAGLAQFFDRDTTPSFEAKALKLLARFVDSRDIEYTLKQLEKARQSSFFTANKD